MIFVVPIIPIKLGWCWSGDRKASSQ